MNPEAIAQQYWRFSQHFTALPANEREVFLTTVVAAALQRSYHPLQQRLLSSLLGRARKAA